MRKWLLTGITMFVILTPGIAGAVTLEDLTYYETQYHQELAEKKQQESEELVRKAQALVGKRGGQCVIFAKKWLGITESWGAARNVKTNSTTPELNAVIKTTESRLGHVGVVIAFDSATVTIVESNYTPNVITIRTLSRSSRKILGYRIN